MLGRRQAQARQVDARSLLPAAPDLAYHIENSGGSGGIMFKNLTVFAALATAAVTHAQQPAAVPAPPATTRQATAAELFGARDSVQQIDISPDGQHVVYLQPGPGRSTVVYIS